MGEMDNRNSNRKTTNTTIRKPTKVGNDSWGRTKWLLSSLLLLLLWSMMTTSRNPIKEGVYSSILIPETINKDKNEKAYNNNKEIEYVE